MILKTLNNQSMNLFDLPLLDSTHEFGGVWTQDKLNALQSYLRAFTAALSNQKHWCTTVYIDAFAGTGDCGLSLNNEIITIAGSAKLALGTDPTFDEVVFIEKNKKRFKELEKLKSLYPQYKIHIYQGDANLLLPEILIRHISKTSVSKDHRGVMFIDPYGMHVEWDVLKKIASTGKLDVWYLFPLSGLYRQAAKNLMALDSKKKTAISRILGDSDWEKTFYRACPIGDMFGAESSQERAMEVKDFVKFVTSRLETIFPYVHPPLILPKFGPPQFALYFALSNSSPKAISLAKRIATHLLK